MRSIVFAAGALVAAALPALAQQSHAVTKVAAAPAPVVIPGAPEGWVARFDRTNADPAQVKVVPVGEDYRVTLGPSGIFFNPANVATGAYRAHAEFTQLAPARHPEGYGLFVGGQKLDADDQDYLYFLVRQDGKFLVKHRAGSETHTLSEWTAHEAVRTPGADGQATNALAIDAGEFGARFYVNGVQVYEIRRAPYLNTDGVVGLRINHNLDVQVSDFGVAPATAGN